MINEENQQFKKCKEILVKHISDKFSNSLILIIDNLNIKKRLEEVFKYDIQEMSKYSDEVLFLMRNPKFKVFRICTNEEYLTFSNIIKKHAEQTIFI